MLQRDHANRAYWSANISGVTAGNNYQFEITNQGIIQGIYPDPYATSSDPIMPIIVVDPTFTFTTPFRIPHFENFIIYQTHIGSFAGRRDGINVFTDATDGTAEITDFDYIRSMNFNAIQFLPTSEYRGMQRGRSIQPKRLEVLYGNPDDLRTSWMPAIAVG